MELAGNHEVNEILGFVDSSDDQQQLVTSSKGERKKLEASSYSGTATESTISRSTCSDCSDFRSVEPYCELTTTR